MTKKKKDKRIKELQDEERKLFDTYKTNNSDEGKVSHLERMAACIRERMTLQKK